MVMRIEIFRRGSTNITAAGISAVHEMEKALFREVSTVSSTAVMGWAKESAV